MEAPNIYVFQFLWAFVTFPWPEVIERYVRDRGIRHFITPCRVNLERTVSAPSAVTLSRKAYAGPFAFPGSRVSLSARKASIIRSQAPFVHSARRNVEQLLRIYHVAGCACIVEANYIKGITSLPPRRATVEEREEEVIILLLSEELCLYTKHCGVVAC